MYKGFGGNLGEYSIVLVKLGAGGRKGHFWIEK